MESIKLEELSGLTLAYLGDAIWELRVREQFINRNLKIKHLNKLVKSSVNAVFQSELYLNLLDDLEEKYIKIAKRARNAKSSTFPKSCTINQYKNATAFEALIAVFYIEKKEDEIEKIINRWVLYKN